MQDGKKGKSCSGGHPPWNTLWGESHPLLTNDAVRLKYSDPIGVTQTTSPSHQIRCSLVFPRGEHPGTFPALNALVMALSTGPFCCDVRGTVSSCQIPWLRQYSTNITFVNSIRLSVRKAPRTPISATKRFITGKWRM